MGENSNVDEIIISLDSPSLSSLSAPEQGRVRKIKFFVSVISLDLVTGFFEGSIDKIMK